MFEKVYGNGNGSTTFAMGVILALCLALASGCGVVRSLMGGGKKASGPQKVQPEAYPSAVAEAHAGQIAFSKSPIPRGPESDAAFETRFTLDDPVHVRPFLADSAHNTALDHGISCGQSGIHFDLSVRVGNASPESAVLVNRVAAHTSGKTEWLTLSPDSNAESSLTAAPEWPERTASYDFAMKVVPLLEDGDNELNFALTGWCFVRSTSSEKSRKAEFPLAEGRITLQVAPGGAANYRATKGPLLPASRHPEHEALMPLVRETVDERYSKREFVGTTILSNKWNVSLHEIHGRPVSRTVEAALILRDPADQSCTATYVLYEQSYAGHGNVFHDRVRILPGNELEFPCDNVPM